MSRRPLNKEIPPEMWAILTVGGALELINIHKDNGRYMTTLVRYMKSDKIGKILLTASWLWLTYHFFFQREE